MLPVSLADIQSARERIAGVALRTPLHQFLGQGLPEDSSLWLKAESLQRTGSFKFRGAYNAIASLAQEERNRGVITYSSGNHGQAVACAASLLGIQAVVVMPEDAIQLKIDLTRQWGAEIVFAGHTSLDRERRALQLIDQRDYVVIPPFDDRRIIAGQGTTGLEILEQQPDVTHVLVPVGGGGLISGIATSVKSMRPDVRVIGVEPEGAADAKMSLESGSLVTLDRVDTVADGLRTSRIGTLNFETMRQAVDAIITVPDDEILRTVGRLANESKLVVEPSGAVTATAVLSGIFSEPDATAVCVLSGGNIDPSRLISCLDLIASIPA